MRSALVVVVLAACGRIGFDETIAGTDGPPVDAPPLPSLTCSAKVVALPATVATGSSLAVLALGPSYRVVWVEPQQEAVVGELLDGAFVGPPTTVSTGPLAGVTGLFTTPSTTLFVATGNATTVWSLASLPNVVMTASDSRISAQAPIISDAGDSLRAWVRGDATGITVSYLNDGGSSGQDRTIPTGAIVSIAGANNSDHTHLTWSERATPTANPQCFQCDLDLVPISPDIGGSAVVDTDCKNPRIDSGPAATDSIMTVYETSAGPLRFRYHGGTVDLSGQLAASGTVPKVAFDGTRFWAAWLAAGELFLARIEQDGTLEAVAAPGWNVVGDQAFQLVRNGNTVELALLDGSTLSLLRTCAGM